MTCSSSKLFTFVASLQSSACFCYPRSFPSTLFFHRQHSLPPGWSTQNFSHTLREASRPSCSLNMRGSGLILAAAASVRAACDWKNVHTGGGGGFVPSIRFHPSEKGVAFARTDIGGLYRLNEDDSWTAVTDANGFAHDGNWNRWGVDALALDPSDANKVYIATGMYTNDW